MMAKRGRPVDGSARRYDVIVAMCERTVFDAALLESLPQLKLLVTTGMAKGAIQLDAE